MSFRVIDPGSNPRSVGGEVMPKLSCKGWMGIHQEMCGEMIIPGKGFSIWKENITLWEMDILY